MENFKYKLKLSKYYNPFPSTNHPALTITNPWPLSSNVPPFIPDPVPMGYFEANSWCYIILYANILVCILKIRTLLKKHDHNAIIHLRN